MTSANRGFHPILAEPLPYTVIDCCVQIWPDADFANAHRHGVTVYGVTAWLPHATLDEALQSIMFWHLVARQYPNIVVVNTADDIRRVRREGKAGLLLAAQDADVISNRLHRLEAFYRLGLRMMLLAYNASNQICDGCLDRTDSGLTCFGELVVSECNRLGLLLDCAHVGRRASLDIAERSAAPVVFSHTAVKKLVDHPRNVDDEQIKACAASGGFIGIASWGPLLYKPQTKRRPTVGDFIEHVDYVAQLLGNCDHLAIGTDFSLGTYPDHWHDPWGEPRYKSSTAEYDKVVAANVRSPERFADGFSNYGELTGVIERLLQRGYTTDDVAKIMGGNALRVFDKVWK